MGGTGPARGRTTVRRRALTTYSTFAHETVALAERRAAGRDGGGVPTGSVAAGLAAALPGRLLGTAWGR